MSGGLRSIKMVKTAKFLTDMQIEYLNILLEREIKTFGNNHPLLRIEHEEILEALK